MVYGLNKFKEYLGDYTKQYVFIGGTACDILMNELGASFRATKDLDIVLIIEELTDSFANKFWQLIEDGGYQYREKSTGKEQFFRFSKPAESGYPVMIELFSRKPYAYNLHFQTGLTPIRIEDSILSLSAILLDDSYYEVLFSSRRIVDGFSVIEIETMILFKIKTWLDLKEKSDNGEHIDSRDIRKHKNDIFRLLANVLPTKKVRTDVKIRADIKLFMEKINSDRPDLMNLGIKRVGFQDMIELLKNIYF